MKIAEGYAVRKIAGDYLLIPYGQKIAEQKAILTFTESSGKLLMLLASGDYSVKDIVDILKNNRDKYGISEEMDIEAEVDRFTNHLYEEGIITK